MSGDASSSASQATEYEVNERQDNPKP